MNFEPRLTNRIALIVMFLSAALFSFTAWQVFVVGNLDFDRNIALYVRQWHSDFLTRVMVYVTFLGSSNFLLPVYFVLVGISLFRSTRMNALLIAFTGVGADLLVTTLKHVFGRSRPIVSLVAPPTTFSFPSGHSGSGMTLFLLLAFLITRIHLNRGSKLFLSFIFVSVALLIGFSRIYLEVHYPTDVLAGFCVAWFWLSAMYLLCTRVSRITKSANPIVHHRNV